MTFGDDAELVFIDGTKEEIEVDIEVPVGKSIYFYSGHLSLKRVKK